MVVLRALVRPVARSMVWMAPAAGAGLGLVLVAVPLVLSLELDAGTVLYLLRMAALSGALGMAFVLDDPARHTTDVVPVQRPVRQGLRLVLALPPLAAWWAVVCALAAAGTEGGGLPVGAATLEAAALVAAALAIAAGAVRFTSAASPGLAAGGAVLAIAIASAVLPGGLALTVPLGDDRWEEAHRLWAAVLTLGLAAWTVLAQEPAGRRSRVTS
ncbi:hypothetical protein [Actinomadura rugatobispora]|uniref:ABC transporter n=1 Tax=Actinomadura rugatobispora TaxID=1994 RepID=A0ABW0ZU56_9ACTN|nr:ABC transporter [Actinomadura rugatobispora]